MQVKRLRNDELYHHGVKGQRWGIRRYQNPDGSLTEAGRRRYLNPDGSYNTRYQKEIVSRQGQQKAELTNKPLNEKSDAEIERRKKIAKTVAITAGIGLAVVGTAVATKKIGDHFCDKELNNVEFQRIAAPGENTAQRSSLYVSMGRHDNKRYENIYGAQVAAKNAVPTYMGGAGGEKAYKKVNLTANKVKVASDKNAAKAFNDLYKNDAEFRKHADASIKDVGKWASTGKQQATLFRSGGNEMAKYKAYQMSLGGTDHGEQRNKFYNSLKNKGYSAIHDINDRDLSGYNTKNPLVLFDTSAAKVVKETTVNDAAKMATDTGRETLKLMGENYSKYALGAAALGGAVTYKNLSDEQKRRTSKNASKKTKK